MKGTSRRERGGRCVLRISTNLRRFLASVNSTGLVRPRLREATAITRIPVVPPRNSKRVARSRRQHYFVAAFPPNEQRAVSGLYSGAGVDAKLPVEGIQVQIAGCIP